MSKERRAWGFTVGLAVLVVPPLSMSARLVWGLAHDTRTYATVWLERHPGKAILETYAGESKSVKVAASLNATALRVEGVDYLVTSSFMYGRFAMGARLPNQHPEIYATHERYTELFERPFVEIAPRYRSFGFSNPVIRIVDVRHTPSHASVP